MTPAWRPAPPPPLTSTGGLAEFEDGTLYATDTQANKVYSLGLASAVTPTPLAFTGLNAPTQIAIDGLKTVTVLDSGNNRLVSVTSAGSQTVPYTAGSGLLATLTAFTTDGSGTFYLGGVLNASGTGIVALDPAGNATLVATTPAAPTALAVNGAGDLWETDSATLRHLTFFGNSATATQTVVANNLGTPTALSVDPGGTAMLAQGFAGTVLAVRPDGSSFTLLSGLTSASAVVVDGRSVLYALDGAHGTLFADDRRTTTYAFGNENVGSTSAPLHRTISNDGNLTLAGIGGLPGDSYFMLVPEANGCTAAVPNAGTSLTPGAFCNLSYTFEPAYTQTYNETGDEFDSTSTASADYSGRALTFTGTGVQAPPSPSLARPALTFSSTPLNTAAPAQTVTLTNTGAAPPQPRLGRRHRRRLLARHQRLRRQPGPRRQLHRYGRLRAHRLRRVHRQRRLYGRLRRHFHPDRHPHRYRRSHGRPAGPADLRHRQLRQCHHRHHGRRAKLHARQRPATPRSLSPRSASPARTPGSFALTSNTCGTSLAAGASCTLLVAFAPQAAGTVTATLAVVDSLGTQTSTLSGTGIAPAAPQSRPYPAHRQLRQRGYRHRQRPADLYPHQRRQRPAAPHLPVTLTGPNAGSFVLSGNTCGKSLAAGASCTLLVSFAPQTPGTFTATLAVVDAVGTQTSALTGNATAPAAPAGQNSAPVRPASAL